MHSSASRAGKSGLKQRLLSPVVLMSLSNAMTYPLIQFEDDTDRTEEFLLLVHKYTDIQELTPAIINEFVDRVLIHKAERIDGERVQEIEVYLNFIGKVELPAQEISEKELAEIREKRRIRERNAMYQRRRRA